MQGVEPGHSGNIPLKKVAKNIIVVFIPRLGLK